MRYSKRFLKMCEIYKTCIDDCLIDNYDWSNDAKKIMYEYESKGLHKDILGKAVFFNDKKPNGYFFGKRGINILEKLWKKDVSEKNIFFAICLFQDLLLDYPEWYIKRLFLNFYKKTKDLTESELKCFQDKF